jgi:uncharacterized membrane protein YoaK (UPF0700 family)
MSATGRLAASLAMIAGYVDAYGILTYNTFLSFMSGNTTITGYSLGQGHLAAALPSLVAILAFVVGSIVGTFLVSPPHERRRLLVLALVAGMLLVAMLLVRVTGRPGAVEIAVLSVSMGMLNTTTTRIGAQSINLAFVTGTLSRLGSHVALAWRGAPLPDATGPSDTHAHRAVELAGVWSAFLVGAVLGGIATPRFATWTLMPPTVALLALAALERK